MPTENRSSNTDPRDVFIRLNPLGLGEEELRKDNTGFEDQRTHSDYLLFLAGYRETHPAPQPHPEPIAWMVGTAFWWTKEEAERDAAATGLPIVGLGPMTGTAPAEEHQGEPVALPDRKLHVHQGLSHTDAKADGWNACLDEIAKLGPLYTRPVQGEPVAWQDPDNDSRMCTAEHKAYALSKGGAPAAALATLTRPLYTRADPAEIERLRTELDLRTQEREKFLGWCRDARAESTKLRAQLADRDALLRMVYLDEGTTDEKCARVEQIISASAEPSAPVEIDERADFERHVILTTGRPIDSELKRHPVRHDEYECRTMQTRWNDWQARAALDRKPS